VIESAGPPTRGTGALPWSLAEVIARECGPKTLTVDGRRTPSADDRPLVVVVRDPTHPWQRAGARCGGAPSEVITTRRGPPR